MAVAVYISNTPDATEVCLLPRRGDKEIVVVGYSFPNAVPVKLVGAGVPGVIYVSMSSIQFITPGETLSGSSGTTEIGMKDTAGRYLLDTAGRYMLDTTGV